MIMPYVGGLCLAHHLHLLTKSITFFFFKDHLKIQWHKLSTVQVAFSRNCVEEPSPWKHWDHILSSLRDASRAILLLLDNNAIWVWGKISTLFRRGEEWLDIDDSEWEHSDADTRIQQPSHGTLHSSELQPQPKHADPDTPEPSHAHTHTPQPSNAPSNTPASVHAQMHENHLHTYGLHTHPHLANAWRHQSRKHAHTHVSHSPRPF